MRYLTLLGPRFCSTLFLFCISLRILPASTFSSICFFSLSFFCCCLNSAHRGRTELRCCLHFYPLRFYLTDIDDNYQRTNDKNQRHSVTNKANRKNKQTNKQQNIRYRKQRQRQSAFHHIPQQRRDLQDEQPIRTDSFLVPLPQINHTISTYYSAYRFFLQEAVVALHLGNIALRRRVEAARHQLVWSLDNEASSKFFKGRCTLSLASVLKGERESLSLSLYTDGNHVTPASLRVQIFPVEEPDEAVRADPYALIGTDLRFCVHVVGADNIPAPFTSHSFCKLILRLDYKEDRSYNTATAEGMTNPRWGLVKQFEIPNLTREIISYFYNQPLLAFEVFGFMT
eukprot:gene2320-1456_t